MFCEETTINISTTICVLWVGIGDSVGISITGITATEIFVKFRPLLADTEHLQNINYKKLGYFRDGNVCWTISQTSIIYTNILSSIPKYRPTDNSISQVYIPRTNISNIADNPQLPTYTSPSCDTAWATLRIKNILKM